MLASNLGNRHRTKVVKWVGLHSVIFSEFYLQVQGVGRPFAGSQRLAHGVRGGLEVKARHGKGTLGRNWEFGFVQMGEDA